MKGSGGLVELRGYEGFGLVHGVYALKILGLGFAGSERQTSQSQARDYSPRSAISLIRTTKRPPKQTADNPNRTEPNRDTHVESGLSFGVYYDSILTRTLRGCLIRNINMMHLRQGTSLSRVCAAAAAPSTCYY